MYWTKREVSSCMRPLAIWALSPSCRPPSNEPRISPNARGGQLRVPPASPRYLVLRWHPGDFRHARLSRISHHDPAMLEWALADALSCALNDRLLWLLHH